MEMKKLFRQKSIDKVNSPDDLTSYLRVTSPPIWIAFVAIIIFLAGTIFWATFAKLDTTAKAVIVNDNNNQSVCYISEKYIPSIKAGMTLRTSYGELTITEIATNHFVANEKLSSYEMALGKFEKDENIFELKLDTIPVAGPYSCDVVLESVSPISFLFSRQLNGGQA